MIYAATERAWKPCSKCGVVKADSEYFKSFSSRYTRHCKACLNTRARQRYLANPPGVNEEKKAWLRTKEGRLARNRYMQKYRHANPDKGVAHSIVRSAIKAGTLLRRPCEVCGEVRVDAHHEDYSKPLDVTWLCHTHHLARHRLLRAQALTAGAR